MLPGQLQAKQVLFVSPSPALFRLIESVMYEFVAYEFGS